MKATERVIYDDWHYFDDDFEEGVWEDLAEIRGISVEEAKRQISDMDFYDEISFYKDADFGDMRRELKTLAEKYMDDCRFIVGGTVGRWNGTSKGWEIVDDVDQLLSAGYGSVFQDCESFKVWDENGHLYAEGAHHDGTVCVEIKGIMPDGESLLGDIEEGADELDAIRTIWDDDTGRYSAIPRFAEREWRCAPLEFEAVEHKNGMVHVTRNVLADGDLAWNLICRECVHVYKEPDFKAKMVQADSASINSQESVFEYAMDCPDGFWVPQGEWDRALESDLLLMGKNERASMAEARDAMDPKERAEWAKEIAEQDRFMQSHPAERNRMMGL